MAKRKAPNILVLGPSSVSKAVGGRLACGAQFLDTFPYLDQMGRLAWQGVKVIMHNTLATKGQGLLNGKALASKPNN